MAESVPNSSAPGSGSNPTEAEAVFLRFLARKQEAPDLDFEVYCRGFAHLQEDLARLHTGWTDLQPVLDSLLGQDLDLSLSRMLAKGVSPANQPTVALDIEGDDGNARVDEILEQLARSTPAAARYDSEGELERGGMGAIHKVWDRDLRRHLAMKIMLARPSDDDPAATDTSDRMLARFLDEALVTGQLDHPGIVPVHDLGIDDSGQVFFTMKLVRGRNLKDIFRLVHQEAEGWTLNRAVGVILRVCEAVAYAHSKGVLHRDIKPANIMVGRYGEVYLMDWGLARVVSEPAEGVEGAVPPALAEPESAIEPDAPPDAWLFSSDGQVLGTPVYMSPEQARGEVERVDERSDVYSLGALLYHLLTARMPYVELDELPLPFTVLMRVRREPVKPIAELAPDAPPTLVAICERAMSRAIEGRHPDAAAMAAELEDYLEDISEAREEARRQARRAGLINEFLLEMLAWRDPELAQGRELTVRDVLDRASGRIADALPGQPLDEATLRTTIGNIYKKLAHFDQAEPHLQRAAELLGTVRGEDHEATLDARTDLALLYRSQGRLEDSERLLRDTLAVQERMLGANHASTLRTTHILGGLLHRSRARLDEAEALFRRCIEGRRITLAEDHPDTLTARNSLALLLSDAGRHAEAIPLERATLADLQRVYSESHPTTLIAMNNLANALQAQGQFEEAEALSRRCLDIKRHVLGETHPETLLSTNNLGLILQRRGQLTEAERLVSAALAAQRARLGNDHPDTLISMNNLGLLRMDQGRHADSEPLLREVVRRSEMVLGGGHRNTGRARTHLGRCLLRLGRRDEAVAELQRAADTVHRALDPGHQWIRDAEAALAEANEGAPQADETALGS